MVDGFTSRISIAGGGGKDGAISQNDSAPPRITSDEQSLRNAQEGDEQLVRNQALQQS